MNALTITGRATADADLRATGEGTPVAAFSIAHNVRGKDASGQWVDVHTSFFEVRAFGRLANWCADHVQKGALVLVAGELVQRSWEGRAGKRSAVEIKAREVCPLPRLADYPAAPRRERPPRTEREAPAFDDDVAF